jgi:hypothetical protein
MNNTPFIISYKMLLQQINELADCINILYYMADGVEHNDGSVKK